LAALDSRVRSSGAHSRHLSFLADHRYAVIIAAKTILQTSYSRDVETSADAYAVDLMKTLDADPRALGTILTRIAGSSHGSLKLLLDHPETKERVDAINSRAEAGTIKPVLTPSEWTDIKRICSESKG
jgi:Zn-dependent protease with chaperone function